MTESKDAIKRVRELCDEWKGFNKNRDQMFGVNSHMLFYSDLCKLLDAANEAEKSG